LSCQPILNIDIGLLSSLGAGSAAERPILNMPIARPIRNMLIFRLLLLVPSRSPNDRPMRSMPIARLSPVSDLPIRNIPIAFFTVWSSAAELRPIRSILIARLTSSSESSTSGTGSMPNRCVLSATSALESAPTPAVNQTHTHKKSLVTLSKFKFDCECITSAKLTAVSPFRPVSGLAFLSNKGQSNLAKGDIALLSHSLGSSTRREVGPGGAF